MSIVDCPELDIGGSGADDLVALENMPKVHNLLAAFSQATEMI